MSEAVRQRKEQIDEGLELAKKIDALRITYLDLQKQYSEYVSQMKSVLEKEVGKITRERDALKAEVSQLNKDKDRLRKILDDTKKALSDISQ